MPLSQIDLHFLSIAQTAAMGNVNASTTQSGQHGALHKKRGCVIAKGNNLIAQGASQHLGGNMFKPEALEERHAATINAELVALAEALKVGLTPIESASIYISDCPNWITFKMLSTLGFKRIIHGGPCLNDRILHYAKEFGIEMISVG